MPFDLLGVIDLKSGRAVHARRGDRARYEPVRAVGATEIEPGDARALARAYVERLGITELYVADLDAIVSGTPQDAVVRDLVECHVPLWLDAGIASVDDAHRAIDLGATTIIVGLETLPSFEALESMCRAIGGSRVAFSLDLREGEPLAASGVAMEPAHRLAVRAADAGASAVIVLDLARVGTGVGFDLELIGRIREATPNITLLAGGGVAGWNDLVRLNDAGCDGALAASALLDGSLTSSEILAARTQLPTPNSQPPKA